MQEADYRLALQVLKVQTHENNWVSYGQVRHVLKLLSTRLTSNSDSVHIEDSVQPHHQRIAVSSAHKPDL